MKQTLFANHIVLETVKNTPGSFGYEQSRDNKTLNKILMDL